MKEVFELFIIGMTVSLGPCLAFCSPVILPYIAATRKGFKEGLSAILIFSFTRLIVYCILGLLAVSLGRILIQWFQRFGYWVSLSGGLFISLVGLVIIFKGSYSHYFCQLLGKQFLDNHLKGPLLLGLTVGILPCLPILGVLAYIALKAQSLWQGFLFGLAFGAGKFISPLIPLGVLASSLPVGLIKNQRIYNFFSRLCGIILFLIGVNLISELLK